MRYRHLSYAYTLVIQPSSVATQTAWRPPADVYETLGAITVTIELAGVDPEEMEVSLFENALVVEGGRRVPELDVGGIYHAAEIRRGPLEAKVLPVGGIKEKVLAAHRSGIRTVILPRENERDLEDVPAELRREIEI